MLRLIRSEFIKGHLLFKILVVLLWVLFARFFIKTLFTAGLLNDYISIGYTGYLIAFALIFLTLSFLGRRFVTSGLSCVPYWGRYINMIEIARLMKDETFEKVEIPGHPEIKDVRASENWVEVQCYYFYKPLTGKLTVLDGSTYQHEHQYGHYTAIDGTEVRDINLLFPGSGNTDICRKITETVNKLFDYPPVDCYKDITQPAAEAFKKVWGDKPYEELLTADVHQLKQKWLARIDI